MPYARLFSWLLTGALVSTMAGAYASKLYKYQDAQGNWHFSDTLPQGVSPSEQAASPVSANIEPVIIRNTGTDAEPDFQVSNNLPGPIELEFSSSKLLNIRAIPALPLRMVVPAATTMPITRLRRIDPDRPWSYSYTTRFVPGDPAAQHETGKPYLPPFPPIKEFSISESLETSPYKQYAQTRHAVEIPMPANTVIFAARSGTVMEVKSARLAPGGSLPQVHYVKLLHSDGTFGVYAPLQSGSVKARVGDQILRGQPLGELAPAPGQQATQLTFVVQKNTGMRLESIPFQFAHFDGSPVAPKPGLRLRHPP